MKRLSGLILLACLVLSKVTWSNDRIVIGGLDGLDPFERRPDYAVCLAISGGGARGLAAIGVLRAFEEKGIRVRALAGTSMGGVIGGLYACGYSPEELNRLVSKIDFTELYTNRPSRRSMFLTKRQDRDRHLLSVRFRGLSPVIPQGLTAGQRLTTFLVDLTTRGNYLCGNDFERLPIPFKTVSTDILTGHEIVLDSGSIADAMRASMAFPLAFTGVERDGMVMMDGGIVTPIPVMLVREMCDSIDFVVALNTASSLRPKADLVTPVDIANQVTTIMTADRMKAQLEHADFIIQPPIDSFSSTDFQSRERIVEIGYQAGLAAADSIVAILQARTASVQYMVDSVEFDSSFHNLTPSAPANLVSTKPVTRQELVARCKEIARLDQAFRVEAQLIPQTSHKFVSARNGSAQPVVLRIHEVAGMPSDSVHFVFDGNEYVTDSILQAQVRRVPASQVTSAWLHQAIDSVLGYYHDRGFDLATVRKVKVDTADRVISMQIDEAIIRRIDVRNNPNTKGWYVSTLFPLEVGEPYSTRRASQGISNIYATDLFEKVTVDLAPYNGGAVVTIRVMEREFNQVRFGWHWDDEYESEELAEIIRDNIGGMGIEFALHGRYSPDRQEYFTRIKADRIFHTYLTSRVRVFHEHLDRQLYEQSKPVDAQRHERKSGVEFEVGQQIARFGTVTAGVQASRVTYTDDRYHVKEGFNLRMLRLESLLETFDRFPFPSSGKRSHFALDFAGEVLGGGVEFTRFYGSLEAYWNITSFLNYHPKAELGLSRAGLPPTEKFYLGGLHSLAGFRTHQLSGDKMVVLSNELRLKLPLRLYLTAGHYLGEAYESSAQIKLRNLRHGWGVSLALDSWIGPMEIGYGIVDSNIDRVYVNAGFVF